MAKPYPDQPFLRGRYAPWTFEGEIHDCIVEGEIPEALRGSYYRNGANPQFAPRGAYHAFDGDGMIHGFQIDEGRCRYWNRWVRTERFELERRLGRSAFGGMTATDGPDPATEGVSANAANTNIVWHANRLLALWEGGAPYQLDPESLDTIGVCDFDGDLMKHVGHTQPGVFTAHPKFDPGTGEMLFFGYSFFGPHITYGTVDRDGKLTRLMEIEVPYASMMHDFVVSEHHVVFPVFPAVMDLESLAKKGAPITWQPERGTHIGVMPRDGTSEDVVWIEADPCHVFHFMNAHSEGNTVVVDACRFDHMPVFGNEPDIARLHRWTIDLDSRTLKDEQLHDFGSDFPRLDPRCEGRAHTQAWATGTNTISAGRAVDLDFDSLLHMDFERGTVTRRTTEPGDYVSEPAFVPLSEDAPLNEGFVLSIVHRAATGRSELLILDAQAIDKEPLATVKLPHRIPFGFHGNWRPA